MSKKQLSTRYEDTIRDAGWDLECEICYVEIDSWTIWVGVEYDETICDSCHAAHFGVAA